jgi:glutaredoxin-related protein
MRNEVTDKVRSLIFSAITSQMGNGSKPVRILREVIGTANDLFGRPFCSDAELIERRAAMVRGSAADTRPPVEEAAPVIVYFDGKDHRTLKKMEDLLKGRAISYRVLDISDDESTHSWVTTKSGSAEFPICFVAGESMGGLEQVLDLDVNGDLARRVFGIK